MEVIRSSSGPKPKQAKTSQGAPDQVVKPLKKTTTFADLPPEIHLMIWEMAIDLPPSIVTIGASLTINHGSQNHHDRQIDLKRPDTNQFNRWQWAQKMAQEFLYAQQAVFKTFGTRDDCLANPLNSVRRRKDIALYIFKGATYQNYSWFNKMDKQHNRKYMSHGVEHVGILWDRTKTNAFWCYEPTHCINKVKLCPNELYHFLDHFAKVKHVYIHVLLKVPDTKCRSKNGLLRKMSALIEAQKKRTDLVRFEDSDRIWIEINKDNAKRHFKDSVSDIFNVISAVKHKIGRNIHKSYRRMEKIKFHILVASYYKDVDERP